VDGRFRATALVLYVVGLVVLAAATTAAYLAMRDVMAIGGSCASGGPYEIATPCPKGTGTLMVGGIFGWFVGAGLTAVAGSQLPGGYGALALAAWPALFLSLGWNFLDFGFDPAGGGGTDGSLVFCGVLFFLMGGVPLLFGLKRLARTLWPTATPREAAGGPWGLSDQIRAATSLVQPRVIKLRPKPGRSWPAGAGSSAGSPTAGSPAGGAPPGDIARELERLADLHSRGALDDDEFERAKDILLGAEEDRT
jgi:Short C-terminal domain